VWWCLRVWGGGGGGGGGGGPTGLREQRLADPLAAVGSLIKGCGIDTNRVQAEPACSSAGQSSPPLCGGAAPAAQLKVLHAVAACNLHPSSLFPCRWTPSIMNLVLAASTNRPIVQALKPSNCSSALLSSQEQAW